MPAAVAVPAIASVAGAGISALGSHLAGKSQERSTTEALDFARQQEIDRKKRYADAMAAYKQQYDAWNRARQQLLGYYGIGIDLGGAAPMPTAAPAGGSNPYAGESKTMRQGDLVAGLRTPAPQGLSRGTVADLLRQGFREQGML